MTDWKVRQRSRNFEYKFQIMNKMYAPINVKQNVISTLLFHYMCACDKKEEM
jgi:hypothetical protein